MYSWKITRTVCAVLLALPLVHLAWLMAGETIALLDSSPEVWSAEVDAYNRNVVVEELPVDPLVVVGGRLVTLWPDLATLLSPRPVLMRGVGDATVDDISHHYDALIGLYRPETVVLLPGNSEFRIRDNKSAAELLQAVARLVALDSAHGHTRQFYIFSPLVTPLFPSDRPKLRAANTLLQDWANTRPEVVVIDPNPLLATASGQPDPRFFRSDGIHLNSEGFLRLSLLLKHSLTKTLH